MTRQPVSESLKPARHSVQQIPAAAEEGALSTGLLSAEDENLKTKDPAHAIFG